jgi:hypothetical protein
VKGVEGAGGDRRQTAEDASRKGLLSPYRTSSVSVVKHEYLWLWAPQEGRREERRRGGEGARSTLRGIAVTG